MTKQILLSSPEETQLVIKKNAEYNSLSQIIKIEYSRVIKIEDEIQLNYSDSDREEVFNQSLSNSYLNNISIDSAYCVGPKKLNDINLLLRRAKAMINQFPELYFSKVISCYAGYTLDELSIRHSASLWSKAKDAIKDLIANDKKPTKITSASFKCILCRDKHLILPYAENFKSGKHTDFELKDYQYLSSCNACCITNFMCFFFTPCIFFIAKYHNGNNKYSNNPECYNPSTHVNCPFLGFKIFPKPAIKIYA